jgi:hypothetical protein
MGAVSLVRLVNGPLFASLSTRSRRRKLEILRSTISLDQAATVLDVGGEADAAGVHPLRAFAGRRRLTILNRRRAPLARIRGDCPELATPQADARSLPFPDKSFDLVYSNAVIEHVGGWEDQRAMAGEIQRVGRSWFVTTPNRWFPFEFHLRLPLVGWLPAAAMRRLGRPWSYDHERATYRRGVERPLRLLTARELRRLFPGSRVVAVRITFWPETLVAVGGEALGNRAPGGAG